MPDEHPQQQQQAVATHHRQQEREQHQPSSQPDPAAATCAIAAVKYNNLLKDALTVKQDAEEDAVYLDTASDEKVSRLVHKIGKYENARE